MSIFDWFNISPATIVEFFARLHIIVTEECVRNVCDFIIVILILWGIYKLVFSFVSWVKSKIPLMRQKHAEKYIHEILDHDFKEYLSKDNRNQYVETQFLSCPPHDFDEPNKATTASTRESMRTFCDRVLKDNNTNERLYIVLAGSGMGKTTFMVNLFCRYVKENLTNNGLPFDIRLLRLDGENIIKDINDISNDSSIDTAKTILLLDALDENRDAAENFAEFQTKLEDAIEPFRFVMITCRDQFFDNEKMVPGETSWQSTGREKNLINYNKIYISPFSDEDIDSYLRKKYKGERKKRTKAKLIIDKCKSLMARPLLLSYVDDLVDNFEGFNEISDIYEILIEKWLQREVNGIKDPLERDSQKEKLYHFSSDIAKKIYENWKETKKLLLTPNQMNLFMTEYGYATTPYDAKRRSLINRNVMGEFKFAHKSFLEYFLAKEYYETPTYPLSFEGMDMAYRFYEGMCIHEFRVAQDHQKLCIQKFEKKTLAYEATLSINDIQDLNFNHLSVALEAQNISLKTISFSWRFISPDLLAFFKKARISNLVVLNYKSQNVISPKELLKISSLASVSFKGPESEILPNGYVSLARRLSVLTMFNDRIITSPSYNFFPSLSIGMNIEYQKYLSDLRREGKEIRDLTSIIEKFNSL